MNIGSTFGKYSEHDLPTVCWLSLIHEESANLLSTVQWKIAQQTPKYICNTSGNSPIKILRLSVAPSNLFVATIILKPFYFFFSYSTCTAVFLSARIKLRHSPDLTVRYSTQGLSLSSRTMASSFSKTAGIFFHLTLLVQKSRNWR